MEKLGFGGGGRRKLDFPELSLVFADVFFQGQEQSLGMNRAGNYPGLDPSAGSLGLEKDKIHDELGLGMVNRGHIYVSTLGQVFVQLNLDFYLFFFFGHFSPHFLKSG
jgi:hypothetical protein